MTSKLRETITDMIWPLLTGDEDKPEYVACLNAENIGLLADVEIVADQRINEADERYRHVERKLLALLTLTTVFSAVITTGVVAVATFNVNTPQRWIAVVAILLVAYIALQLARTLLATVKGLTRREFYHLGTKDMSPLKVEPAEDYRLRILNLRVDCMYKNERIVNKIVSEMAVAHVAIRNALGGSSVLIVSAIVMAIWQLFAG